MQVTPHKTVVDEKIFFNGQLGVASLQITHLVARNTVAQGQILCARWRTQRVSLHKAQTLQGFGQARGREQAARYGITAQLIQSQEGCSHTKSTRRT